MIFLCLIIFDWMPYIVLHVEQKWLKQIVLTLRNVHPSHSVRPLLGVAESASSVVGLGLGLIVAVVNFEYTTDFRFLQWWALLCLDRSGDTEWFFLFLLHPHIAAAGAHLDNLAFPPVIDCNYLLLSARLLVRPVDLGSGSWVQGGRVPQFTWLIWWCKICLRKVL